MKFIARVPIEYIRAGTGDLCQRLDIRLTPTEQGDHTQVQGNIFALISFFTALATHYHLSLEEIREKFA